MPRFRFCLVAFLTFVAGLFALSAPCGAAQLPFIQNDAPKWQRYSSDGEELAFLLPEQPVVTSVSRPESYFRRLKPGRMYAAYADGTVYVVLSLDNRDYKDNLDVFVKEFSEYPTFHNNMTFERDVSLLGLSGKQYRLKAPGAEGIAQFYLTKNHAYIFEAVSENINQPSVNQFLINISTRDAGKTKNSIVPTNTTKAATEPKQASAPASTDPITAGKRADELPVLKQSETSRRAVVVTRPEPGYTEEARQRGVVGTVRIRCVLSSDGSVKNITSVNALTYGLTEKAVAAARNMRFIPAVKDGKSVSTYVTIEYSFNLY